MSNLPSPRLIVTPEYSGYYMRDINDALTQAQRALFADWLDRWEGSDQDGGVFHRGRLLVYGDTWEWFLAFRRKELVAAEEERVEADAADAEGHC